MYEKGYAKIRIFGYKKAGWPLKTNLQYEGNLSDRLFYDYFLTVYDVYTRSETLERGTVGVAEHFDALKVVDIHRFVFGNFDIIDC